ncbi:MAG: PilZ domain-containing protein [Terriglobales bacterium]
MPEQGRDGSPLAKKNPTVAIFPIDQQSQAVLTECFAQHGVEVMPTEDLSVLSKEKLEGCVVSLNSPNVEETVAQARRLPWQKRMVIYAIGPPGNIVGLTKYGINVVLDEPVARTAAIKAIRGTRLLLFNELRRYVRLPLAAPTTIDYGSQRYAATSLELSAGGMSLEFKDSCAPTNASVSVSFAVPGSGHVSLPGVVCWTDHNANQFGVRFDPDAQARQAVQAWIEDYLELEHGPRTRQA